jgi:glycosyltransferase involved in cell wall biosynthesis
VRKVLFIDHEVRLSGGQRDLLDLVTALAPAGLQLHLAVPGPGPLPDALAAAGTTVHFVRMNARLRRASRYALGARPLVAVSYTLSFVAAAFHLIRLVRRLRPDLIHTNSMKSHLMVIPAAALNRVPLIWHIRDILPEGWLLRIMRKLAGIFVFRVVCLSEAAANQYRSPGRGSNVRVVYNGIRLEQFGHGDRRAWREQIGASPDEVVVCLIGQVARWKGQDVFLDAARRVLSRASNVRFLMVGDCLFPENEAPYLQQVADAVQSVSLRDRVVWIGCSEEVPAILSAVDILVHASREAEPFGRVLVEGMAAGKPVVTTDIGAGPEIVPEDAGFLTPPGDAEALACVLFHLLSEGERARCGRAATRAASRFDIAHTARGVLEVYAEATCA